MLREREEAESDVEQRGSTVRRSCQPDDRFSRSSCRQSEVYLQPRYGIPTKAFWDCSLSLNEDKRHELLHRQNIKIKVMQSKI